jgi:hypothetical protein
VGVAAPLAVLVSVTVAGLNLLRDWREVHAGSASIQPSKSLSHNGSDWAFGGIGEVAGCDSAANASHSRDSETVSSHLILTRCDFLPKNDPRQSTQPLRLRPF